MQCQPCTLCSQLVSKWPTRHSSYLHLAGVLERDLSRYTYIDKSCLCTGRNTGNSSSSCRSADGNTTNHLRQGPDWSHSLPPAMGTCSALITTAPCTQVALPATRALFLVSGLLKFLDSVFHKTLLSKKKQHKGQCLGFDVLSHYCPPKITVNVTSR